MRTEHYPALELERFLEEHFIATLDELKGVLDTPARMTVLRKLQSLGYLTSYSHRGGYYTLRRIPHFDSLGLWQHRSVFFSKHGNLMRTAKALVDASEAGMSASELDAVLSVETKHTLLSLFQSGNLCREKFGAAYVYLTSDPGKRRQQKLMRSDKESRRVTASPACKASAEELRAAIVLFYSLLDEKQRRLFAGLESLKEGHGGDSHVAELLGLDPHTVAKGRRELLEDRIDRGRVRQPGAGRKPVEKKRPKSSP